MKLSPIATARLEDQIDRLLWARRIGSHSPITSNAAIDAAYYAGRALAAGSLPTLCRRLRELATDKSETIRMRARFAILALAIEAIVHRRAAARNSAPHPPRRKGRGQARKARQAIDNRIHGETVPCAVCGQEFRAVGRNWKYRTHCRPKCTNKAWMKAHPRRAV
jgi:hypothetical protein